MIILSLHFIATYSYRVQVPGARPNDSQRPQGHLQEDPDRAQSGAELEQADRQAHLGGGEAGEDVGYVSDLIIPNLICFKQGEDGRSEADQPQCGGQAGQAVEAGLRLWPDTHRDTPHAHGGAP